MRKIEENPNEDIKGNEEEQKNRFNENLSKVSEGAKNVATKAAEMKKNPEIQKGIWKFIFAHLPVVVIIVIIILIILYALAFYGFISSMPGMFMGKIKQESKSLFHLMTDWIWDLVPKQQTVDSDEVVALAQYLENMGYSITGNGFADVTYSADSETTDSGRTKKIEKVTSEKYIHNNLQAYMMANEATYDIAQRSLVGDVENFFEQVRNIFTGTSSIEEAVITDGADKSSGLINIAGLPSERAEYKKRCSIDRDKETLTVYTDSKPRKALNIIGIITGNPELNGLLKTLDTLKFGTKYVYDLSDWTAKYGRPTEMFISLHLATMMPDLVYKIASADEFNTKVDLQFQEATVELDDINVKASGGQVYNKVEIEKSYIQFANNQLLEEDRLYETIENVRYERPEHDSLIALHDAIAEMSNDTDKVERFIKSLYNHDLDMPSAAKEVLGSDYGLSNQTVNVPTTDEQSTLDGITIKQLQSLMNMLISANTGIQDVDLPYIAAVRKHWFYRDIQFTKSRNNNGNGVYNTAAKAKKKLKYATTDDDDPLNELDITMDATLTAQNEEGIYYQVNEPITAGPNENIINLFKQKYYRYDGTIQTAKNIAIAKLIEQDASDEYYFEGEKYTITDADRYNYETGKLPQKETPKFGSASDTLSAFSILKNVHTSAADSIYRMLKELATSSEIEGHLEEGSLNSDLLKVLLWPIHNGEGTSKKDDNTYGINITDVEGQEVLAPGDGEIISSDGDSITIKFGVLSEELVDLLEYIYKGDFYNINSNIVNGMTMTIKGVNPSASGTVQRGQTIATASEKVSIVMEHIDKSLVGEENSTTDDNVEDYLSQDYTKEIEDEYKARKERANNTAGEDADITGNTYAEFRNDLENNTGAYVDYHPDGNTEIPDKVSDDEMYKIYAIVASEDDSCYEGALAVISTAYNRVYGKRKNEWKKFGDIFGQLTAKNQYYGYGSSRYHKFMNNEAKIPEYVINAVDDCMKSGKINTAFDSCNADRDGADKGITANNSQSHLREVGYDKNSTRYIRKIGAQCYFNGDGSPEYYVELTGTDIFNEEASGNMLQSAKKVHDYVAQNDFSYDSSHGKSVPLSENSPKITDCSHFVSLVLYDYGFRDIKRQYSTTALPGYFNSHKDSFAKVYDARDSGFTSSVSGIGLQPGDICFIGYKGDVAAGTTGHVQIFAGYDSSGNATWYNCGSDRAIKRVQPQITNDFSSRGIVNVYRVIK